MSNAATKVRLCSATRELATAWTLKAEYVASFPDHLDQIAGALRDLADTLESSTRQLARAKDALTEATYLAEAQIIERALNDLTTKRSTIAVEAMADLVRLRENFREIVGQEEEVVYSPVIRGTALDPVASRFAGTDNALNPA